MKHGKKSEQKSATTESKKSGKTSRSVAVKKADASPRPKAKAAAAAVAPSKSSSKAGPAGKNGGVTKAVASKGGPGAGKGTAGTTSGSGSKGVVLDAPAEFTNALLGAAFHRAIKKYSNAFRRLTD